MRSQVRILKGIKRLRREDYSFFVFGLGNPGSAYGKTLHNAGFMALDLVARREGVSFTKKAGNTLYSAFDAGLGEKVFMGKPQTYMNLSGEAVTYFFRKYRFSLDMLIIVHDDLDISPGRIKIKRGGGAGGHKGIQSIVGLLGSPDFTRVKIGVGKPPEGVEPAEYVLGPPLYEDEDDFYSGVHHASDAIMTCLREGVAQATNYYNSIRPYEKS